MCNLMLFRRFYNTAIAIGRVYFRRIDRSAGAVWKLIYVVRVPANRRCGGVNHGLPGLMQANNQADTSYKKRCNRYD